MLEVRSIEVSTASFWPPGISFTVQEFSLKRLLEKEFLEFCDSNQQENK
jgi:hypothetical protein